MPGRVREVLVRTRASDRAAYAVEQAIESVCLRPGLLRAQGTTWQVEPMPHHDDLASVEVVCSLICARFQLAAVKVRLRKGAAAIAHYERDGDKATIALSEACRPWSHATVIHELAHHAAPDDGHGPRWRQAQITMLAAEGLATMANLLAAAYHEAGLGYPDPTRWELE